MIHWGIIGLGNIAHHFVKDLDLVSQAKLYAVASRSYKKSLDFASQYQAVVSYKGYASLLADPKVQVVYIATPHNSHKQWSKAAILAGKHVLCEKPLGMNTQEVREVIALAASKKVFFMEALWTRFNPSINAVLKRVKGKELGKITYLQADFGFYALDKDPMGRVLNKALGGGSLLDIGIYPIFLSYLILGMPKRIMASATFSQKGTEIQTAMIFEYNNAKAVLYSGFTGPSSMVAQISGDQGLITIDSRWHETQGYTLKKQDATLHFKHPTLGRGYTYEINAVHQALENNWLEHPQWTHKNSEDLSSLLDQVIALTKTS